MHFIGVINRKLLKEEFGELQTDVVILTDERKQHILNGHGSDYEYFDKYAKQVLEEPDLVLKDAKNENTVFIIKYVETTGLNIVLKLAIHGDEKHPKNSIMTAYRMREKNVKKLSNKNKVLYKREYV